MDSTINRLGTQLSKGGQFRKSIGNQGHATKSLLFNSFPRLTMGCLAALGGQILCCGFALAFVIVASSSLTASEPVSFDVPAITIAQTLDPSLAEQPMMGGKLVRIRLPISTCLDAPFEGQIDQYLVQLSCPSQAMRVIDFWPKTEVYSDIDGTVAVKRSDGSEHSLGGKGSVTYQSIGNASLEATRKNSSHVEETYHRLPPMQVVSSSGTIHRGHGVFFKFLSGPMSVLDGVREVAFLAEVPVGWRADLLDITIQATGKSNARTSSRLLASSRMWVVMHLEGDRSAAVQASRYTVAERNLRRLAASSEKQVQEKSLPTVFHKLGAALELVEPRIPEDYLTRVIFAARNTYYDDQQTNRLPVDLRIAILDYWEEREKLVTMATHTTKQGTEIQSVSVRNSQVQIDAL